jgi:hypothetical protein
VGGGGASPQSIVFICETREERPITVRKANKTSTNIAEGKIGGKCETKRRFRILRRSLCCLCFVAEMKRDAWEPLLQVGLQSDCVSAQQQ